VLWERAPEKAATYDVEYRTLEPVDENSPPRTRWIRLRDVKATPAASGISLEISRLPWNSSWFVRGIAKDKSGQVLGTSDVARIASPSNPSRLGVLWVIPALLAAGIAAGVLFQRKRDQSAAEERARIERLEGDGGKSG
jgi:hypothetical protein